MRVQDIKRAALLAERERNRKALEAVSEPEVEVVRARNAKGHLMADDPSTPDVNEAWTTRPKKKVTRKKKD